MYLVTKASAVDEPAGTRVKTRVCTVHLRAAGLCLFCSCTVRSGVGKPSKWLWHETVPRNDGDRICPYTCAANSRELPFEDASYPGIILDASESMAS